MPSTPTKRAKSPSKAKSPAKRKLSSDVYEVEKLLERRKSPSRSGTYEYKIRWKGYSEEDDTWEHEDEILDGALIEAFLDSKKVAPPTPPRRQKEREKAAAKLKSRASSFDEEEDTENSEPSEEPVKRSSKSPAHKRSGSPKRSGADNAIMSPAKSTRGARSKRTDRSPLRSLSKSPKRADPPIPTSVKRTPAKARKSPPSPSPSPVKESPKKSSSPRPKAAEAKAVAAPSDPVKAYQDLAKRERMWFEDLLLLVTVASSIVNLWAMNQNRRQYEQVTRPLPTLCLVFLAGVWTPVESQYSTCIILGLLASVLGCVFSLWPENHDQAMMAVLLALCLYTLAFLRSGADFHASRSLPFYLAAAGIISFGKVPMEHHIISLTFIAVFANMTWRAAAMIGHRECYQDTAMFGAILLSTAAALRVIHWFPPMPVVLASYLPKYAVPFSMVLYNWGQYLVARSVVGTPAPHHH